MKHLNVENMREKHEKKYMIFAICFAIVLAGEIIYWISYYPGGFNLDALGQWNQVHGKQELDNWHPILTTFIYWCMTRICDNIKFCIAIQLIFFPFTVAFLLKELYIAGISRKYIVMMAMLIAYNPAIGMNNVCLIKDVPFTCLIIWLVICLHKIYRSQGRWLCHKKNEVLLTVVFVMLSLVRHNAIFLYVPVILIGGSIYRKHRLSFARIGLGTLISLLTISVVLFPIFDIKHHSNMVGEVVGIPMSIMANAYIYDNFHVPEDVQEFMENIASYEEWKENYVIGEWDSCKWEFGGIELFEKESLTKIIRLAIKTIVACPEKSYQAFRENTRLIWQIIGYSDWNPWIYIEENDYGIIPQKGITVIKDWTENLKNSITGSFIFWNIGTILIILFGVNVIATAQKCYQVFLFTIPIIIYDLLTMCLLSGPSFRYFYFNSVLIGPFLGIVWEILENSRK